jgi:putative membrane-bound dehydrogenase-like protein
MRNTIFRMLPAVCLCLAGVFRGAVAAEDTADHPSPLSPAEAAKHFKVAEGLEISLVVSEPEISQPLSISFDDRGRMWVLQYRQYPNPNGLNPVAMDNWLRTKYDRVPEPPPKGPKGQDRISICEDTDGDGHSDRVKHFLSDLNLASGMALGYGGVFVVQPPYLLFYADADQDDLPDGPPKVLLKGFGMEDAHAFANSLTWGPDGWLYGAQGSTVTANIRGIEFQQGVWRYHPRTDRFELFAEGGGNSFGLDFDRFGNVFAAGNTVEPLVHHVQGAYYVKGFGKHGPLHNPHAYGYFQPVLHHGYVGDSLTGGALLYQGGGFPKAFNDACIAPNTRHNACRWSTVETRGSTFATRHAGDFVTSDDKWFRPVDMTTGPDGAVYIADWYDYNISHSSPKNRSQWYQPSRLDGRVWRVAPPGLKPRAAGSFDLAKKSSDELISLLKDPNDWYARAGRRLLAERRDRSIAAKLGQRIITSSDQREALQALWSIYVSDGLDERLAETLLRSPHEYVRAWTVRLLGDENRVSAPLQAVLIDIARNDSSVVVRSQLACTAKRLPADAGLPIVAQLLIHDDDTADVHIPLLLWWAIEDRAASHPSDVLRLFASSDTWRRPLVEQTIIERVARRFTATGDDNGFAACAKLIEQAPTEDDVVRVLTGMLQALSGRKLEQVPPALESVVSKLRSGPQASALGIEIALRMNVAEAASAVIAFVVRRDAPEAERVALIRALGETRAQQAVGSLLQLVDQTESEAVHIAALSALGAFSDPNVADAVLRAYPRLTPRTQARVIELLCAREPWAWRVVQAVEDGQIAPAAVAFDQLQQLRSQDDPRIAQLVIKHWGKVQAATPLEKQGRMTAILQMLGVSKGDADRGHAHFQKTCATCHKLHGEGNAIGPDLTGAERKNRELLTRAIIDPSAVIRQEFLAHVAQTTDGRVLTGLLAESTAETITLLDAKNERIVLNRADLEQLQESSQSLMPDNVLDPLTDEQIRDLFAYLQSDANNP